jgi:hypothetical protein
MHAKDGRYAKFFLFTEKEVEILCESNNHVCGSFSCPLFIYYLSLANYWRASTTLQWLYSDMQFWTCQTVQPFISCQGISFRKGFSRNW